MPPPPFHCLAPDPRTETACQGWCGVRHEGAPSQSIPLISSQRASSAGKRSLRGRGPRQPLTVALATAGCPAGGAARHISAERSILREGIPAPLAQIPSPRSPWAVGRVFSPWPSGDPHRAREKCRAGTEQLFHPGVSSGRLAGTGSCFCFPSTHVRSEQRKKEKKTPQSFRTAVSLWPLYPSTASTV